MTEARKIKQAIARDNRSAYRSAKAAGRAYTLRGNSIVHTKADGSIIVVRNIEQVRVRLKENEKVIVLK